jgi:hypothetical protein
MKKLQKFEFHLRWRIEDIWLTVGEPLWSSLIWAQFLIRGKHKGSWKKWFANSITFRDKQRSKAPAKK